MRGTQQDVSGAAVAGGAMLELLRTSLAADYEIVTAALAEQAVQLAGNSASFSAPAIT